MKVDKVSKIKTHITCDIPVYMKGHDKPVDKINIILRFRKNSELKKKEYVLINKSIDVALENFSRREKVGSINSFSIRSKVVGIKPIYQNILIDCYTYNMVKSIMVYDRDYLSNVRNKKLEKILNEN
jgi:hypothetical protein